MPITNFISGQRLDAETARVIGVAFEMTCVALRIADADDRAYQSIANKIINLAKAGERNPDVLCERTLSEICSPPQGL